MTMKPTRVEATIAGKKLTLETGQVARQAGGAVIATLGETRCFAATTAGAGRDDIDFFPLVCDYREKTEAAGKIPGGFFKREGRPTTKEILTMRLIDRSIRPMFPDGYKSEVQVMTSVMQYDGMNNPDVVAMIAAFASIRIAGLPFETTLGAIRVCHIDGKLVAFPNDKDRRDNSRLDLVVSGHEDGICMVESSAKELTEDEMIDALTEAHEVILQIVDLVNELVDRAGKPQMEFKAPSIDQGLRAEVFRYEKDLSKAMLTDGKHERGAAVSSVRDRVIEDLTRGVAEEELKNTTKNIKEFFGDLKKHCERAAILSGRRVDGRKWDDIRQITIAPNFNPRQHGSVLFTRGETQAMVSATLGTPDDEQVIDGVEEEYKKNFYLHYNFPAYSVGETRRIMGPGRREIGHGMLAERALTSVMPSRESFPYTTRIVSDITESNGSSSMASVCGGCLAMMLAGVPLSQPVAGIAMGLVSDGDEPAILSDILGSEDHCGDMDFKVAGSGVGITALQMDIKITGVSRELLSAALEQARVGRIHILREMLKAVPSPSAEVSEFAPRMETIKIPSDRIGFLIGPGGKNIRQMQADYEVRISIVDDEGNVQIYGTNAEKVKKCRDAISATMETPEVGSRYNGTVKSVRDFGAFIEILPGVEALCHISELGEGFIENVTDVVNVGDEIDVIIINVDDRGKIKVSHKATLEGAESSDEEKGDDDGGDDDRPRRDRGDREDRGGDDRGARRPRRSRRRSSAR
ncbi:Polyribonucleotide nucleotidyltransferase [Planctomycetes bacterium Poly30]|uniref:Polyribonucleotide nucleotidyltransferase n=2 Tax=Saltatorellus ferox TaxID=2528018 RepID=A0A518ER89_9BACT|nr:Polyribonucleotide nucleotidyltransferase [Planctomycetes bacterium Poly30]